MSLGVQLVWLFTLAIPVACVAWTVTHEELFREPRDYALERSSSDRRMLVRKFFYLLTCEYCFSHYVALAAVLGTGFHLLMDDWRGTVIAWLAVVWVANQYMGVQGRPTRQHPRGRGPRGRVRRGQQQPTAFLAEAFVLYDVA